jgi:hypothetical protein
MPIPVPGKSERNPVSPDRLLLILSKKDHYLKGFLMSTHIPSMPDGVEGDDPHA